MVMHLELSLTLFQKLIKTSEVRVPLMADRLEFRKVILAGFSEDKYTNVPYLEVTFEQAQYLGRNIFALNPISIAGKKEKILWMYDLKILFICIGLYEGYIKNGIDDISIMREKSGLLFKLISSVINHHPVVLIKDVFFSIRKQSKKMKACQELNDEFIECYNEILADTKNELRQIGEYSAEILEYDFL